MVVLHVCFFFKESLTFSTPRVPTQVANPSFSHKSVHHFMVTKLPNHWWANSWAITYATASFSRMDGRLGSYSNRVSLEMQVLIEGCKFMQKIGNQLILNELFYSFQEQVLLFSCLVFGEFSRIRLSITICYQK